MSASVSAEEPLLDTLKDLSEHKGVSVGVIIGQVTSQRSYVIHLAPTPNQSKDAAQASLKDVDEAGLAEHARYITRMLPGGLWVLGLFVVSEDELFKPVNTASLRRILTAVDKSATEGFYLQGKNPSGNLLVFHYNGVTKKYLAKSFDRNLSDAFKNVDWKFQSSMATWCVIATNYQLKETVLEPFGGGTFQEQLKTLLGRVTKEVEGLNVVLADVTWDSSSHLDVVLKALPRGADNGDSRLKRAIGATLYRSYPKESKTEMRVTDSATRADVAGTLSSRVFLHQRATVKEASDAIRQDILRSLAVKLEMHWDSLVDEEGSPEEREQLHEPPRRILVYPAGWHVALADFLFPGEKSEQAVQSFKELLDLDIQLDQIEDDFEVQADSPLLSALPEIEEQNNASSSVDLSLVLAIAVPVLAIVIYFLSTLLF